MLSLPERILETKGILSIERVESGILIKFDSTFTAYRAYADLVREIPYITIMRNTLFIPASSYKK